MKSYEGQELVKRPDYQYPEWTCQTQIYPKIYVCFIKNKKKKHGGIYNCAIVICLSSFLIWYSTIITLLKTYFSHSFSTLWSCLCSNSCLWIFSLRLFLDILYKTFFTILFFTILVPLFSCTNLSSHWFIALLVFDVLCECWILKEFHADVFHIFQRSLSDMCNFFVVSVSPSTFSLICSVYNILNICQKPRVICDIAFTAI